VTNLSPSCEFQCDQLLAVHKRKRRRLVADNPVTLLLWAGRQVCRPGLSWATNLSPISCRIRTKRLGYRNRPLLNIHFIDIYARGSLSAPKKRPPNRTKMFSFS
jgi:hypothetical protein